MIKDSALTLVFLRLRGRLAKAVSSIVPPKEIEDIVQETYVRVIESEHRRSIRQPEAFLYRTARNLALDHVKRAESRLADGMDNLDELQGPDSDPTFEQVVSDERFGQFCEAVRFLPLQCRRAFVLSKVYGFSQKEVAKTMNLSENTVEKHIAKGLRLVARQVEQQGAAGLEGIGLVTAGGRGGTHD